MRASRARPRSAGPGRSSTSSLASPASSRRILSLAIACFLRAALAPIGGDDDIDVCADRMRARELAVALRIPGRDRSAGRRRPARRFHGGHDLAEKRHTRLQRNDVIVLLVAFTAWFDAS